ncbi:hypothetical protein A1Q2_07841 [Trichosporon asahii var. asahii CBS 8904]|uniref:Uncharacterized protein n=1 Tax=Trichosporon asahii var. asahii (strain CBS 8904) TaxID=1220162 RepID=K1W866_TRIAC|nr:hypothetical protein A1Q2_07841 [Trichosporon asahii var. asahii CBS 8904]
MLVYLFLLLTSFLAALASPLPQLASESLNLAIAEEQVPIQPLRWTTQFSAVRAESVLPLEWTGGSGEVEIYYVPQWPEQRSYDLVTVANTTESSYDWTVPELSMYPEGTTFIIGIKNEYGEGNAWYDLSPVVPFRA